ncbi:MAG TPA: hypothetical protein VNO32_65340, partial [Candidatus Acidoferrum sp.]|nr:hypothetical protein [Candidatus Acidoferrum sp.]
KTATTADGQLYAPPSPAIGIRTVQPMFVYDVISRRPIENSSPASLPASPNSVVGQFDCGRLSLFLINVPPCRRLSAK